MTIETLASAGSVFLFWHFLMLGLCVTGLLIEKILRNRNALARSALLRSTLAFALLLPFACAIWRALPSKPAPPTDVETASSAPMTPGAASQIAAIDWNHVAVWRPLVTDLEEVPDNLLPVESARVPSKTIAALSFLGISVLTSIALLVRFVIALFRCSVLRRQGKPLPPADEARYRAISAAMDVVEPPALLVPGLESPVLLGFFQPVILLPANTMPRDEVFSHELTHLRRRDLKWHLLAHLAAIIMPLQPGFWMLKKALERADEDICDDAVLVRGADAAAYADLLLHVAESQRAPNPELCLPMAAFRSQLERRLQRLLDATRPLARRLSLPILFLGLGPLLAAGVLVGAIFLDTERAAAATKDTTSLPSPLSSTPPSSTASDGNSSDPDLKALEKQLLDAQEDAARRRILYDTTKTLSDHDFLATMISMNHEPEAMTSLRGKLLQTQTSRDDLVKQGYASQHPRIIALDNQLKAYRDEYDTMLRGMHTALKIDADMADSAAKVLQQRIEELKASEHGKTTTDAAPPSTQPVDFKITNPPTVQTGGGTLVVTNAATADPSAVSAPPSPPTAASPQPDYSSWLAHAAPEEKDALAAAYKAVDDWHAAIDFRNISAHAREVSDNEWPDYLDNKPATQAIWENYLQTTYAQWGVPQSRQLKTMLDGWVDGVKKGAPTDLSLAYETKFQRAGGTITLAENIGVHRNSDGQWRVARFFTFTPTEPPPPVHASSAIIRSLDVEFIGERSDEVRAKILAASGFAVGSPCSPNQIHRALRQIFATGLFTNAAIKTLPLPDGIKIALIVQPNPTVAEVDFKGISAAEQAKLASRVHLHTEKGAMSSGYLVFQDAQAITTELAAEGLHLAAKGTTKLLDSAASTAEVTFAIMPSDS